MKRNILSSLLLALVVFGLGCKPKKIIVATPPVSQEQPAQPDKKQDNLNLLKGKDLSFNTLALKGKTKLDINGDENSVTINIRIQKDKKIWAIITAAGGIVEVARAVITPDSLLLLNKLEKTYTKKPFSYIYNFTNKQISFGLLQAIFAGNTIPEFTTMDANLVQENGVWVLSGNSGDLAYRTLFNTLLKPAEVTLNDAKAAQALKVSYGKYTPVNNALFPSSVKINTMSGEKKINIEIEFTKIESNVPVDFPFTVPKNFQVIN
ncbi:DUF4292 domain-containing protein [Pedobacter sp. KR3-3]|uniref:DUF4292 domain-containing protein n=1 Tax=Pedobacter albus TaxID=3113905 RepID=A0ABU7IC01_9SPHI|nr:DUF4292 domain-containing protein [Pedobacter sp. KR3-3]MEE1946879.1 DUF4292 domain-containing protein [Pedobacter sp. KR3-3]